jgi:hypothetical protein
LAYFIIMNSFNFIQELISGNVNMILTGSLAANYHGYDAHSYSNDIDFIIDDSKYNLENIYKVLKKYDDSIELNNIFKSYSIRTQIVGVNEKIDMFRYSIKTPNINYINLIASKNYIIDTINNIELKIISKLKLIETIQANKQLKYQNIL